MIKYYLLVTLIYFTTTASAQTWTSLDEQTGDWDDPASWDRGTVPNIAPFLGSDQVVIDGTVTLNGNVSFYGSDNLTINSGDTLTINGNLNIGGGLSPAGFINDGVVLVTGNILVAAQANFTNNSELAVLGNLSYLPLGTGSPADITQGPGASTYIGGSVTDNGAGTFDIDPLTEEELVNSNPGFADYINMMTGSTLPVTLVSFEAFQDEKSVVIEWSTASELNNDYFILEKSYDGVSFFEIEKTEGNGTTDRQQYYSIIDLQLEKGLQYYRLLQVDLDGTVYDEGVISINVRFDDSQFLPALTLFPNPTTDFLFINGVPTSEIIQVQLFTFQGKKVKTIENLLTNRVDVQDLHSGRYMIYILTEESNYSLQFIRE